MTPQDVALKVTQRAAKHVTFEDSTLAIETLAALGCEFVSHAVDGRYPYESDEGRYAVTKFVANETGLHMAIVRDVLTAIAHMGLRIRDPDTHPSGLATREPAITTVRKIMGKRR